MLRIDLTSSNYDSFDKLIGRLDSILTRWEKDFGVEETANQLSIRFENVVATAYAKTSTNVVILVDEYDKPLL